MESELQKINIALKKNRRITIVWSIIVVSMGALFTYSLFIFFPCILQTMGLVAILCLLFVSLWRLFSELYPTERKRIYVRDEGIEIPISRKRPFTLIKYELIEMVILNEMGGGSLYVDIFFTKDGRKYIYSDFQTKINDYKKFVENLRKKGIEVKILEPSLKHQKNTILSGLDI